MTGPGKRRGSRGAQNSTPLGFAFSANSQPILSHFSAISQPPILNSQPFLSHFSAIYQPFLSHVRCGHEVRKIPHLWSSPPILGQFSAISRPPILILGQFSANSRPRELRGGGLGELPTDCWYSRERCSTHTQAHTEEWQYGVFSWRVGLFWPCWLPCLLS